MGHSQPAQNKGWCIDCSSLTAQACVWSAISRELSAGAVNSRVWCLPFSYYWYFVLCIRSSLMCVDKYMMPTQAWCITVKCWKEFASHESKQGLQCKDNAYWVKLIKFMFSTRWCQNWDCNTQQPEDKMQQSIYPKAWTTFKTGGWVHADTAKLQAVVFSYFERLTDWLYAVLAIGR